MDKCFVLTAVFLALFLQAATAGRLHKDGHDFHHDFEVNPETWHEPYPHHHKHGPHNPHEARHAQEFWGHPHSWESHSGNSESHSGSSESHSGSWEHPHFPYHGNHDHPNNWHHHGADNWHDGHHGQLPQYYPGHEHHGPQWNHGGNNQLGSWNQGGPGWHHERPNLNHVGSSWNQGGPSWNQVGSNQDPVPKPSQPDRQNQPGRPGGNQPGPGWHPARPGGWGQASSTTTVAPSPATQAPLDIALCIRSCPVTSEYNPVCGSNNVTYGNPGRLECAKYCGVDVSLQRKQACTAGTQNVTQATNLPPQKPTRFTTIDIPSSTQRPTEPSLDTTTKFTISQDILNNIFTTQSTTIEDSTDDENFDIDIRSRNNFLNNQPK